MENLLKKITSDKLYIILALAIIGLINYFISLRGDFIWDDYAIVVNNEYITSFKYIPNWFTEGFTSGSDAAKTNLYRPVALFAYSLIHIFFGLNEYGYHLTSLALHILNAYLVFKLLISLNIEKKIAFLLGGLFIAHPIQTESVSYIAGLPDTMGLTFILSACLIFKNQNASAKNIFLISLFYVLAVLTKEGNVVLPGLLLLLLLIKDAPLTNKTDKIKMRLVLSLLGISIIYVWVKLTVLNFTEEHSLHVVDSVYTESLSIRLYTFISVLWDYFILLFAPIHLHFEKAFVAYGGIMNPRGFFGLFVILGGGLIAIKSYFNKKKFFFAYSWFFMFLVPVTGIIAINAVYAERWLYGPIIAVLYLIGLKVQDYDKKNVVYTVLTIILVLCSIRTIHRNIEWSDPIKFYENEFKYTTKSSRLYSQYGKVLFRKKQYEKAAEVFSDGLEYDIYNIFPEINYNLANTYLQLKQLEPAVNQYFFALKKNPNFILAHMGLYNIGVVTGNKEIENAFQALIERIEAGEELNFEDDIMPLGASSS